MQKNLFHLILSMFMNIWTPQNFSTTWYLFMLERVKKLDRQSKPSKTSYIAPLAVVVPKECFGVSAQDVLNPKIFFVLTIV